MVREFEGTFQFACSRSDALSFSMQAGLRLMSTARVCALVGVLLL